ncbi:hypothetical protein EPO66_04385 [bacterium]|nr:MAG: hypothetical protein EPO66_04385 [bacterium]
MDTNKPKSIRNLEEKMENLDADSLRYHILDSAKNFKTSWVDLGRALYTAWRDKLYKEWGYNQFDTYTAREIGIKKQTAMKLLRSYYFLEKEEPAYLTRDYASSSEASAVPGYESIDVLRRAKNKKEIDNKDYTNLKKEVFEKGKDAREIKRDLTALIRERQELEPEEAREKKKFALLRRLLGTLKSLKSEIESSKLLPAQVIRETSSLIEKIEEELG